MSNVSFGSRVFMQFNDANQKDTFIKGVKQFYANDPKAFRDRLTVYNHSLNNKPGVFVVTGEDTNLLDSLELVSPRATISNLINAWLDTTPVIDYDNSDKIEQVPASASIKKLDLKA